MHRLNQIKLKPGLLDF